MPLTHVDPLEQAHQIFPCVQASSSEWQEWHREGSRLVRRRLVSSGETVPIGSTFDPGRLWYGDGQLELIESGKLNGPELPVLRRQTKPLVPRPLRFKVFKRDGFRCRYCGASPDEKALTIDHVIPATKNGPTTEANLVTACWDCNIGKGTTLCEVPAGA